MKLDKTSQGELWLQNKPERISNIVATVEQFFNNGRIHAGEAASLHGQLNFSQGQLLGAALKPDLTWLVKFRILASIESESNLPALQQMSCAGGPKGLGKPSSKLLVDLTTRWWTLGFISLLLMGWLHGPYTEHELGDDYTVTRRFGVRQGSKIRPIDNYTESLVNQTTSAGEAISLHSTDVIAATLSLWM